MQYRLVCNGRHTPRPDPAGDAPISRAEGADLRRDWPLRTYHLITVAAGIVSSLLYVRAAPQSQADWFVAAGMLFGMALIITGVGDHRLLVLALQSSVSDAENEQSI